MTQSTLSVSSASFPSLPNPVVKADSQPKITSAILNESGVMAPSTENIKKTVGNPLHFLRNMLNSVLHGLQNAGQAIRNRFIAMRLRFFGPKQTNFDALRDHLKKTLKPTTSAKPTTPPVMSPTPVVKANSQPSLLSVAADEDEEQILPRSASLPAVLKPPVAPQPLNVVTEEQEAVEPAEDDAVNNDGDASTVDSTSSDDDGDFSAIKGEDEESQEPVGTLDAKLGELAANGDLLVADLGKLEAEEQQLAVPTPPRTNVGVVAPPSDDEDKVAVTNKAPQEQPFSMWSYFPTFSLGQLFE